MYKGVSSVLIGDGTTTGTTLPGIKKGDLLIIKENGSVVTASAGMALPKFEKIIIACGIADGEAILSSPIQGNLVSKYEGVKPVAPSEQVTYLGFNGTASTGVSITSTATEYRLRIFNADTNRINGQRRTIIDVNYKATASENAFSVLTKICNLYYAKDYGANAFEKKVKAEIVSDGTFVAADNTLSVIKGSNKATFDTAATNDTGTAFAVGDLVRIGGTGASVPVYKITAINSLTVTLSNPYQGATATVAAASVGLLTTPTEYGIKLTGLAQNSKISRAANEPLDQYEWINFDAAFTDANDMASSQYAATVTTTKAKPGMGYWKQVADAEEIAKGALGDTNKLSHYAQRIVSNVDPAVTQGYASIVITHAAQYGGDFQNNMNSPLRTEIYIPYGTAQASDSTTNSFTHMMNAYFATVLGFTAVDLTA